MRVRLSVRSFPTCHDAPRLVPATAARLPPFSWGGRTVPPPPRPGPRLTEKVRTLAQGQSVWKPGAPSEVGAGRCPAAREGDSGTGQRRKPFQGEPPGTAKCPGSDAERTPEDAHGFAPTPSEHRTRCVDVTRALTHNVTHALIRYVGVTHTYAYYHVYITRTGTTRTSQTHSTSPSHTHTPRVHHAHTCASPTTPSLCTGCVPYVASLWSHPPRTPPLLGVGSTPAASWDPPLLSNRHELRTPRMR